MNKQFKCYVLKIDSPKYKCSNLNWKNSKFTRQSNPYLSIRSNSNSGKYLYTYSFLCKRGIYEYTLTPIQYKAYFY